MKEDIKEEYANGITAFFSEIDGKKEGNFKAFYKSGILAKEEFYKDGKKEGESKIWREDGSLFSHSIREYKDGKEYKEVKNYIDGRLCSIWFYIDEIAQEFTHINESGKSRTVNYRDGEQI